MTTIQALGSSTIDPNKKAAAEQAKAAADMSLKAIQAVSASNAKIAVQPATLNCGANGLSPSPADVFAFLEDYWRMPRQGTMHFLMALELL